jgi:predicted Zn-ribbon and HTH transcriptional regulator
MITQEPTHPANGAGNHPLVGIRYFDRESEKISTIEFEIVDLAKFTEIFYSCGEDIYIEKILTLPSYALGIDHVRLASRDPPRRFIPISRSGDPVIAKKIRALYDANNRDALYDTMEDVVAAIKTRHVIVSRKCPVCGYEFSGYPPYAKAVDNKVVIICPDCQTIITPVS